MSYRTQLYNVGVRAYDAMHWGIWGYNKTGSPELLEKILREQPAAEALQYTFDGLSILHYAIKIGNSGATETIFQLCDAQNVTFAPKEELLRYFLESFEQGKEPNLKLFPLLITDINHQDQPLLRTPLEFALEQLAIGKCMPWSVIEYLLDQGASVDTNVLTKRSPFEYFKDKCLEQLNTGYTYEKGIPLLGALETYANLQKARYAQSSCCLSKEEFVKATRGMNSEIEKALDRYRYQQTSIKDCPVHQGMANALDQTVQQGIFFEIFGNKSQKEALQSVATAYQSSTYPYNVHLADFKLGEAFFKYIRCYHSLVSDEPFKEFFPQTIWEKVCGWLAYHKDTLEMSYLATAFQCLGLYEDQPTSNKEIEAREDFNDFVSPK